MAFRVDASKLFASPNKLDNVIHEVEQMQNQLSSLHIPRDFTRTDLIERIKQSMEVVKYQTDQSLEMINKTIHAINLPPLKPTIPL